MGDLTQTMLDANVNKASSLHSRITALKAGLTDLQNQRQAICVEIWDEVKRVRNGIKSIYGKPFDRLRAGCRNTK